MFNCSTLRGDWSAAPYKAVDDVHGVAGGSPGSAPRPPPTAVGRDDRGTGAEVTCWSLRKSTASGLGSLLSSRTPHRLTHSSTMVSEGGRECDAGGALAAAPPAGLAAPATRRGTIAML